MDGACNCLTFNLEKETNAIEKRFKKLKFFGENFKCFETLRKIKIFI